MAHFVSDVKRTWTTRGRASSGLISLEGTRIIERALAAGHVLGNLAVLHGRDDSDPRVASVVELATASGTPIESLDDDQYSACCGLRDLGGVVALLRRPAPAPLPEPGDSPLRLLVLADMHDSGNVGALARTAHAGGTHGLVASGRTDPWHPRAIRTSMGSMLRFPVHEVASLRSLREALPGTDLFAAVVSDGEPLHTMNAPRRWALVMGGEAHGLTDDDVDDCQRQVSIEMPRGVDSYSVNAAAAVLLFGLSRNALSD